MKREEALKLIHKKIKNDNLIKHCLAVEAVMKELARYFKEDEEKWGLAGLLHDIDYEQTKDNPQKHSLLGAEILQSYNFEPEIIRAIKCHNEIHGLAREDSISRALFCADPITGLIVAATLVLPSKKIKDLSKENILNRYKEKGFAKSVNRETIATCQELNLSLNEFVEISLRAMQKISEILGL